MKTLSKQLIEKKNRPVRVLQYGEGNFLRAFTDYMFDVANEKGVFDGDIVIVKPRNTGNLDKFRKQDCCYTVCFRGISNGKAGVSERVVTSVREALSAYDDYEKYMSYARLDTLKYIVSNTTEAGIVYDGKDRLEDKPQSSYPGKLCSFLYERFCYFVNGAGSNSDGKENNCRSSADNSAVSRHGLIIFPVELIDNNGAVLLDCVLKYAEQWGLSEDFKNWLKTDCIFASTLVDRIVPGFPKDEAADMFEKWGYEDELTVTAEPYGLWIIESEKDISAELPLKAAGMDVMFTKSLAPFKKRKVRILNGAHTSFVPASFLAGNDYVLQSIEDKDIYGFIRGTLFEEIMPALVESERRPAGMSALVESERRPAGMSALVEKGTEKLVSGTKSYNEGRSEDNADGVSAEAAGSVAISEFERDCHKFAEDVLGRFANPYVKHMHMSIALNSVSKWKTRCLPSLLDYVDFWGRLPQRLTFSMAALIELYRGTELKEGFLAGYRNGEKYSLSDDSAVLDFFAGASGAGTAALVKEYLGKTEFHGMDLTTIPGFADEVVKDLELIENKGIREAMKTLELC